MTRFTHQESTAGVYQGAQSKDRGVTRSKTWASRTRPKRNISPQKISRSRVSHSGETRLKKTAYNAQPAVKAKANPSNMPNIHINEHIGANIGPDPALMIFTEKVCSPEDRAAHMVGQYAGNVAGDLKSDNMVNKEEERRIKVENLNHNGIIVEDRYHHNTKQIATPMDPKPAKAAEMRRLQEQQMETDSYLNPEMPDTNPELSPAALSAESTPPGIEASMLKELRYDNGKTTRDSLNNASGMRAKAVSIMIDPKKYVSLSPIQKLLIEINYLRQMLQAAQFDVSTADRNSAISYELTTQLRKDAEQLQEECDQLKKVNADALAAKQQDIDSLKVIAGKYKAALTAKVAEQAQRAALKKRRILSRFKSHKTPKRQS